jgi:RNA polymerase sigma-70 factor (ECF subfamily)
MDHAEVPGLNRARTADLPSQVSRTAHENMNREQRLSRWIDLYSDTILKTCFLYLSDRQQAEDVLQDTWIKAWKHMEDIDRKGITNEKAWLLRIAINTCN